MKIKPQIILFLCLLTMMSHAANTNKQAITEYQFTVTEASHHLGQVEITLPAVTTKTLTLKLPVWRSGRYEILDLSKNISAFSATTANGQPINWNKTDKNTWKLWLQQPGSVTIKYTVYANMLSHRVAHIDETHAFLDASGVFMFAPAFRDQGISLSLHVPSSWQSRSGLTATGNHRFVAKDYDQLVDSPIETGIHQYRAFRVANKQYEIVIWGAGNHDIVDLESKITALHHPAKQLWGDYPFDRYVYMFHVGDGLRGATEHVNSTIIQQNRFNFSPRKKYLKVLSTTAHEFIHTWNVKAYRPAGIAPYNYSAENYSDLFWMAEGTTKYYQDLMLLRSGILKASEFHEKLASDINKHLNNPGRLQQSLATSSFDTWLKTAPQQTHNDSVSIYLEGAMVSWRLDQEIRRLTNNAFSLDELQKRLYQQHNNTTNGYSKADVLELLKAITRTDMQAFWNDYVEGTKAIDFSELLAFYGLKMQPKSSDAAENNLWIGATFQFSPNAVTFKTVDRDSPAWQAGLAVGDQLLAINGIKVTEQNIQAHIQQLTTDSAHQFSYFSAGQLRHGKLTPQQHPHPEFVIKPLDKPSKTERQRYQSWTGSELGLE